VAGTGGCKIYASCSDPNAVWRVQGWDNAVWRVQDWDNAECGAVCTYLTFTTSGEAFYLDSANRLATTDKEPVTSDTRNKRADATNYLVDMVHSEEFRVQNGNGELTPYQTTTCVMVYGTYPGFGVVGTGGCKLEATSSDIDAKWRLVAWDNATCGAICYEIIYTPDI